MLFLFFIEATHFSLNKSKRTRLEHLETSRLVFNYNLQTNRCCVFYLRIRECTLITYENSKKELRILVNTNTQIPFKLEFEDQTCSDLSSNFDLTSNKNKRNFLCFLVENKNKIVNKTEFIVEPKPRKSVYGFKHEDAWVPVESSTFRPVTPLERKNLKKEFIIFPLPEYLAIGVCLPEVEIDDITLKVFLLMEERDRSEKFSVHKGFCCKLVCLAKIESKLKNFFESVSFIYSGEDMKRLEKSVKWKNLTLEDVIEFLKQLCDSSVVPNEFNVYK